MHDAVPDQTDQSGEQDREEPEEQALALLVATAPSRLDARLSPLLQLSLELYLERGVFRFRNPALWPFGPVCHRVERTARAGRVVGRAYPGTRMEAEQTTDDGSGATIALLVARRAVLLERAALAAHDAVAADGVPFGSVREAVNMALDALEDGLRDPRREEAAAVPLGRRVARAVAGGLPLASALHGLHGALGSVLQACAGVEARAAVELVAASGRLVERVAAAAVAEVEASHRAIAAPPRRAARPDARGGRCARRRVGRRRRRARADRTYDRRDAALRLGRGRAARGRRTPRDRCRGRPRLGLRAALDAARRRRLRGRRARVRPRVDHDRSRRDPVRGRGATRRRSSRSRCATRRVRPSGWSSADATAASRSARTRSRSQTVSPRSPDGCSPPHAPRPVLAG